jgi:hypothetical protein
VGGTAALLFGSYNLLGSQPKPYPDRMVDRAGLFSEPERTTRLRMLSALLLQTGVNLHVVIDSLPSGSELDSVAQEILREQDLRDAPYPVLLMLLDVREGDGHFAVLPGSPMLLDSATITRALIGHRESVRSNVELTASIDYTIRHVMRGLRAHALGITPLLKRRATLPNAMRPVFADGSTWAYRPRDPLDVNPEPMPRIDSLLAPAATPEGALARHSQWLSLPVWSPSALFLTPETRALYERRWNASAAGWELQRDQYLGAVMRIEVAGPLAVAIPVDDPLAHPLYFRRSDAGWQFDGTVEYRMLQPTRRGKHTWTLMADSSEFDVAFRDRIIDFGNARRYRDGANDPLAR